MNGEGHGEGVYKLRWEDMRHPLPQIYSNIEEARAEARRLSGNTLVPARRPYETGIHGDAVPIYIVDLDGNTVEKVDASF